MNSSLFFALFGAAVLALAEGYGYGLVQSSTSSYGQSSSYTSGYSGYSGYPSGGMGYGGYYRPYSTGYYSGGYRPGGGYGYYSTSYSRPMYGSYDYSYNGIRPYYSSFGMGGLGSGGYGGLGSSCIGCGMGYYKKK